MAVLAKPIGDFPINDDWVYGLSVKALLETGRFTLPSPSWTNLLPQAYWGALFCLPFGFSFTALRISTLVLGLVGVWATFATTRELGADRRIGLLAAALVAANPLYFSLANTFMTDVPFCAVSAASLYFLVRWARHMRRRDALIGLAIAMVAILIRQAGIVLPAGFAVAYIVIRGPKPRTIAIAALPLVIGALLHFGFQAWLHATGSTPAGEPPLAETVLNNLRKPILVPARLLVLLSYTGLFLLPALAVVAKRAWSVSDARRQRSTGVLFVAAFAVCAASIVAIGKPMPFIDNVLNDFGGGPLTLTDTYFYGRNLPVVPPWLSTAWVLVSLAAFIGFALFVCLVVYGVRHARARPVRTGSTPAMILIGTCAIAYTVLAVLALRFFYDRYVLFLLLAAALFLAIVAAATPSDDGSRGSNVLLAAIVLALAAFSTVVTRDHLEWNRARWAATSDLLASGIPRTSIDGGYEFNGWLGYDFHYQAKPGKSPWWVIDDEYTIASGPMPGFTVHRAYPFRRLLTGQNATVLVLHRNPK
jgi:4-amino-4-deoxy-L-arabinose transferase-like glycosyltransferase